MTDAERIAELELRLEEQRVIIAELGAARLLLLQELSDNARTCAPSPRPEPKGESFPGGGFRYALPILSAPEQEQLFPRCSVYGEHGGHRVDFTDRTGLNANAVTWVQFCSCGAERKARAVNGDVWQGRWFLPWRMRLRRLFNRNAKLDRIDIRDSVDFASTHRLLHDYTKRDE